MTALMPATDSGVHSICGVANLLAAIFDKEPQMVRLSLGIAKTVEVVECLVCHKIVSSKQTYRRTYCSRECHKQYNTVLLVCEQCGVTFPRPLSRVKAAAKQGYKHIWCGPLCRAQWLGLHRGFPSDTTIDGIRIQRGIARLEVQLARLQARLAETQAALV